MRRTVLVMLGALVLITPSSAAVGAAIDPYEFGPTMPAGHCLEATATYAATWLQSTSGRYKLWIYYTGSMQLSQDVETKYVHSGYTSWNAYSPRRAGRPPATLRARAATAASARRGRPSARAAAPPAARSA